MAGFNLAGRIGGATCKSVLQCHIHCASGHFTVTGLRKYNILREKQSLADDPVSEFYVINKRFQFTHSSARLRNRRLDLPKRSQEFIANLRSKERETLLAELLKYQNVRSSETSTKSDLDTDLPETTSVPTPTQQQLRLVAFSNALPFIGFGFFDNAILIIAGDYIDVTIGGALSISTMAAAGLGNMISDVAGIGLAGTVEAFVSKIGVQVPVLTPEQQDLTRTRWTASVARALGIAVGCFIGMFPLLFLKTKEDIESEDDEKGTT